MNPFRSLLFRVSRWAGLLLGCWLAALARADAHKGVEPMPSNAPETEKRMTPGLEPGAVEIHFIDDSKLKVVLREERILIDTAYGKLLVPLADVQQIDFATRLPEDLARKIDLAITQLGSTEFKEREKAGVELLQIGLRAYPALQEAEKSSDGEVRRRAEDLLNRIREAVPPEFLEPRPQDVLYTKDLKITGKIAGDSWRVRTFQFGEVPVKFADMYELHSLILAAPDRLAAQPDPGSLTAYANQAGTKLAFSVTGRLDGSVWGTNVYTLDSALATAAVHAGILKPGQTGLVRVQIVASPPVFTGSALNGVNSGNWGMFPGGAYQFLK